MSTTQSWFWWALLSACFAALTAVLAKVGVQRVDSDMATWIRACVIWLSLTAFILAANKWTSPATISARTWLFLVLSGLAAAASWVCYFRALQVGEASQVAPIDKASLLLVVLFAYVFLGERPSPREWIGIILIGAGVLLLGLKR